MVRPANESDPTVLVLRRTLNAPRERVFAAWTEADQLANWFGPSDDYQLVIAEVDARPGGTYRLGMQNPEAEQPHVVFGEYREFSPPERLVMTWTWEAPGQFAGEETLVTIELSEDGGQTELVLTHERFPSAEMRDEHAWGWGGCLDRLAARFAG